MCDYAYNNKNDQKSINLEWKSIYKIKLKRNIERRTHYT